MLRSIGLKGTLPEGLILKEDLDARVETIERTIVKLELDNKRIKVGFSPGILIEGKIPFYPPRLDYITPPYSIPISVGEAHLEDISLIFGNPRPQLLLKDKGYVNIKKEIVEKLQEKYINAIWNSPFVRPRYDWTRDPHLFENLSHFYAALPLEDKVGPRGPFVENLLLDTITVHAETLVEQRADGEEEGTFLFLEAGSSINVTINFQMALGELLDAIKTIETSPQRLIDSLHLKNIEVSCSPRVFYENEELGHFNSVRIMPDCQAFIDKFTITHPKYEKIEKNLNAGFVAVDVFIAGFFEAIRLASLLTSRGNSEMPLLRGVVVDHAISESSETILRAVDQKPDFIRGAIENLIEKSFIKMIGQLTREPLRIFPSVDLSELFDCKDMK